jgi:dienelactone hydrolase
MPTKTTANAVIHGKVDRGEYTVERVFFESYPGFYVTGSLFRPKGGTGRRPGVLCPHGHWANGRFYDAGEKTLRMQLVSGAERFDPAGRYPLQARCVQLARMGCVVFHYDMVGYADSVQLEHRPGVRPEMNTPTNWGYFSPQAEARLQTQMGLQTYNSIRALDWFSSLPDVDPRRIGVTGASGGGTQTFILCAIDPRPAVAFPAVMVSTAMQGGCTCENCSYLRVGTGNVELAGLIAPRPLGMTAANDWTKEIMTKGLPELKALYTLLGVPQNVMAQAFTWFPHNYNYVSRAVMYGWMNKHLDLGFQEPIVEQDFQPLTQAELTVWDEKHPRPAGGAQFERSLLKWITEDSERQMAALVPRDGESLAKYREIVGGAIDTLIGRKLPKLVQAASTENEDRGDYTLMKLLVRNPEAGEELPAIRLQPKQWNRQAVVWVDREGKRGLFDGQGQLKAAVQKLVDGHLAVVAVDLFGQGEFTADGEPIAKARLARSGREAWAAYAGYTYGYNYPVFSQRVHDLLTVIAYLRQIGPSAQKVHLAGLNGAGHWVAAAKAQAGEAVDRTAIDTAGFRFADLAAIDDPDFLPGGAKYLDLPGIIALAAPGRLWLCGEGRDAPPVVKAAYQAAGEAEQLTVFSGKLKAAGAEKAAVEWLMRD